MDLTERWQRHVHRLTREAAEPIKLLQFDAELTALRAAAVASSGLNTQAQFERLLVMWCQAAAMA